MEAQSFVYMWINTVNGKAYVGSHLGNVNDGYIGSGSLFNKAIKKYGIHSFERTILCLIKGFHKQYIHQEETYYINFVKKIWKDGVYNISLTAGGGFQLGNSSEERKKEVFKKISLSQLGKPKFVLRRPMKESTKHKLSLALMGHIRSAISIEKQRLRLTGKKQSVETIRKRVKKNTAIFNKNMKGWYCTPFGSFISSTEASKHDEYTYRAILDLCKNNQKGYSFRSIK